MVRRTGKRCASLTQPLSLRIVGSPVLGSVPPCENTKTEALDLRREQPSRQRVEEDIGPIADGDILQAVLLEGGGDPDRPNVDERHGRLPTVTTLPMESWRLVTTPADGARTVVCSRSSCARSSAASAPP
jgi:hypothetical protein